MRRGGDHLTRGNIGVSTAYGAALVGDRAGKKALRRLPKEGTADNKKKNGGIASSGA